MYTEVNHINNAIEILEAELAKGRTVEVKPLQGGNYAVTIK